jgi:hypothetical protein
MRDAACKTGRQAVCSMIRNKNWRLSIVFGASLSAFASPAFSADAVRVELNKLEPQDGACRAYLVFQNRTQSSFSGRTLDLVMFDNEGVIAKRLAVDAAPLPADKTSVKLFDIEGVACDNIGRILINDVLDCQDETGERQDCVALIGPSSRSDVSLVK